MTLHLAGHAAVADLEHVGRKSGTVRHTPLRAFRAGDTVIVGLNFGRESDWYQNIKAAGTCRMRLGGEQLTLGAPTLVPAEQGVSDMPWLIGFALMHVLHTAECVRLPIVEARAFGARSSCWLSSTVTPGRPPASARASQSGPDPRSRRSRRTC
jgi:deazaflavin-dependent oxidoreductase (nitroreductase family)